MKVLVLAGGIPQLELMKRLRKKYDGVEILLVDYLKHPIASDYADKFFNISTLDVDAVENVARDEQVDLIITVCTDQALNTVAEVSERLNLPCYIDAKTGKNVTNKKYMKKVMEENRVPTAHHFITEEVVKSLPDGMSFPVIVKPVDCNSSKGVVKVNSNLELQEAVNTAIRYSRTDNAIVEDFVSGRELTIDAFVQGGKSQIAKELEDDNFRIILQSRAGLDYFKPDLEAAKIQLASVTAMMDDIDPDNDHSPDIIHVVSYCEALYLATPDIINDSIKITRTALKEYRRLKKLGLTPDVKTDDIAERTEILETSARKILAAMEETIPDLYSPEGLYIAFVAGWLPVPELWSDSDEFIHAKCWETKMQNGGTHLVDHELLVPLETRINKCIAHNADAEYILKSKYKVLTRV